jgi:hypothetical protein
MRVGQKNKLTYLWARKGSRPRAMHDQRTQSTFCSVRFAQNSKLASLSCCRPAMQKLCSFISRKSLSGSLPAPMHFSSSIDDQRLDPPGAGRQRLPNRRLSKQLAFE